MVEVSRLEQLDPVESYLVRHCKADRPESGHYATVKARGAEEAARRFVNLHAPAPERMLAPGEKSHIEVVHVADDTRWLIFIRAVLRYDTSVLEEGPING